MVTSASIHDKHPLPDLLHGAERRVYEDSADTSQKELIGSKAPDAKDCTNQRIKHIGIVDNVARAKDRNLIRPDRRILGHAVVHVDETPVALLAPGRGKTKKAFVWVYHTTNFVAQRAVLFDFCASRAGEHPGRILKDFSGTLVTDDFSGYHKLQSQGAIVGALCMAHARRKLFEAHKLNGSQIAGEAVALIAKLYEVERDAHDLAVQARTA